MFVISQCGNYGLSLVFMTARKKSKGKKKKNIITPH